jgi:hypothetical protein
LSGTSGFYTDTGGKRVDYVGPIMGKKSIGKVVNVGFIANSVGDEGSSVLRSSFYSLARSFILEHEGDTLPKSFPMLPHAVFGLDFGAVSIGGEVFYEFAHYKQSIANSDRHSDLGIRNIGGILSATVSLKNAWLCPLAGYGIPAIVGEKQDSALRTFESLKSMYAIGGAEAGIEFSSLTLVAGAYYTKEEYSFKSGLAASPAYRATILDLYTGFTAYLLDSLFVAVEYDANLYFDDITDTTTAPRFEFHDSYGYHSLRLGIERPFTTTGVFDAVIPRAGVAYTFNLIKEQRGDTTVYYPVKTYDMQLNAGIGVRKDMFCLDLFVNIGTWSGVLTGPQTIAATLTVGLSKDFLGK